MDLHAGLSPTRVCVTGLFLWCLLFDAVGVHAEGGCKELPVFNPSPLVVKHGDTARATCSICNSSCDYELRVEEPYQATVNKGNQVLWNVPNITDWRFQIFCYIFDSTCMITLDVIVYQPPERVSMSFRNHSQRLLENPSGPLEEGLLYCLRCEVEAVAPAQNMTVAFYRGLTELSVMRNSTTLKSPVNVSLCLNYSVSREDHGATFWCEARLELGPEGPQPPPVVRSHNITANVHYVPVTTTVAPYVTTTTTAAPEVPIMTTPPPHVSTMTTATPYVPKKTTATPYVPKKTTETPYVTTTTAATSMDSVTPSPKGCAGQSSFLHHSLYTSIFVWLCWGLVSLL